MIYLDIETLDFFQDEHIKSLPREQQLAAMRFGCAVLFNSVAGDWLEFTQGALDDLWCYVRYIPSQSPHTILVGWNIINFDWPVICSNVKRRDNADYLMRRGRDPEFVDLFALIRQHTGRWYSLETVAQHNLGRGKLADGQRAAEWLRSDDPEQIAKAMEYCRYDVQLTIDLHAILLRGEPLRLPPRAKRQELNEIHWWLDGRVERIPDALGAVSTK
jgi:hypothetical protein